MTFVEWLLEQNNRDDPVGDLSRDLRRDKGAPTKIDSVPELVRYLKSKGSCLGALDAAREAGQQWGVGSLKEGK